MSLQSEYEAHLSDEEWDRNRVKRERLEECATDARLGKEQKCSDSKRKRN